MLSDLTKIHSDNINSRERLQTLINTMIAQYQISKLQIQPQAVSVSDISLSKVTCVNIGINPFKFPIDITSDIDPHISNLQTQTWFVMSISCDLEPDITIPISRNIFVLDYLDTDMSSGINPGQGIYRVFHEPSNLYPRTSRLLTWTQFVTSLSCDLELYITMPISHYIGVSADLDPSLSAGLNSSRAIP